MYTSHSNPCQFQCLHLSCVSYMKVFALQILQVSRCRDTVFEILHLYGISDQEWIQWGQGAGRPWLPNSNNSYSKQLLVIRLIKKNNKAPPPKFSSGSAPVSNKHSRTDTSKTHTHNERTSPTSYMKNTESSAF